MSHDYWKINILQKCARIHIHFILLPCILIKTLKYQYVYIFNIYILPFPWRHVITCFSHQGGAGPPQKLRPCSATDCATQQWLIVHVTRLNELIHDLLCPNCATASGLFIKVDPENHGFCSSLLLECTNCKGESRYRRSVYTSTRLQS